MDSTSQKSPPPMPPLPPIPVEIGHNGAIPLQRSVYAEGSFLKEPKEHRKCRFKLYALIALLVFISLLLACSIIGFLWYSQEKHHHHKHNQGQKEGSNSADSTSNSGGSSSSLSMDKIISALRSPFQSASEEKASGRAGDKEVLMPKALNSSLYQAPLAGDEQEDGLFSDSRGNFPADKKDALIEPNHLLTLMITKRKVCLFEASTSEVEASRQQFRLGHLPASRLLVFSSLSHNGVPVHPLQFQRYVRSLGVDQDCHVVVYSRSEQVWATYVFWIFKLYGHRRTSLLNGGFEAWKALAEKGVGPYTIDSDASTTFENEKLGDFKAEWVSEHIATFDDIFANFDSHQYDIVDAQTAEEFQGKPSGSVIFGHIRTAVNLPSQSFYSASNHSWVDSQSQEQLFHDRGLSPTRPIIVYDGTSIHSTMVWFALHRLHYKASVYFGSWPEWIIRAPDYLKVIPSGD